MQAKTSRVDGVGEGVLFTHHLHMEDMNIHSESQ